MRIFVTTPQFLPGTPATFYEIRDQKRDEPVMSPFPSWESQNIAACSGPISVYRVLVSQKAGGGVTYNSSSNSSSSGQNSNFELEPERSVIELLSSYEQEWKVVQLSSLQSCRLSTPAYLPRFYKFLSISAEVDGIFLIIVRYPFVLRVS